MRLIVLGMGRARANVTGVDERTQAQIASQGRVREPPDDAGGRATRSSIGTLVLHGGSPED